MRRLVRLGVPGVIAGGIIQINIVVGTVIASLEPGAVSYLYYADRLYQLPLGVVGVAIGVVLLPELARRLAGSDPGAVTHTQNRALEFAMLLTLPAAVALFVVPGPIVQVLFERGAFTPQATRETSLALAAYAVGLPFLVLVKVFSPGYFAREDTATPMRYGAVAVIANVLGSAALFPVVGALGIAIATSASSAVNAGLLGWTLRRRGHLAADDRLAPRLLRILMAALGMGAVLLGLAELLEAWFSQGQPFALNALALALLIGGGFLAFVGLAFSLGAVAPAELRSILRRRQI
jgi:putative peptidoglycan lipid II flippase